MIFWQFDKHHTPSRTPMRHCMFQPLKKAGQTVHMLQIATFWDIYSISPPIYIHTYIHIYIHTHILYIVYTCFTLKCYVFYAWKSLKICPFSKKFRPKSSFLNIFQKIPVEMNSTHPFYPILIPNTSYVIIFICS